MNFKKYLPFTLFFSVVFVLNLLFFDVLTDYRVVSKPLIMASLLGFYISVERKQSNAFIMAMIFALLGDIFLLFNNEDFFLLGLGSFLIMQVLYAYTFLEDRINDTKTIIYRAVPVLVVAAGIIVYLWNGLGTYKIPVAVYSLAISGMVIAALIRKPSLQWYMPVVFGVVLFLISDALIAISKFGNVAGRSMPYFVMATYMVAQYLIVRGVVEKNNA